MFAHLLVPLDGSSLAEAVLPYVRTFGRAPGTRVTLLHLIERAAPASIHGARHLRTVAEAEQYLADVARTLAAGGIDADTHVDTNEAGDTAGRIVDHAAEWSVDLIAMCAHGRNGVGRWLFGSIAQKVLGSGIAPVLFINPVPGHEPRTITLANILLPLDGTRDAETVLPIASSLARDGGGTLHLVMVVPTADSLTGAMSSVARFSPKVTTELLQNASDDANAYLESLADRVRVAGITVQATVVRGEPAQILVEAARLLRADLIVMASHGRAGLEGAWAGSIGNKILSRAPGPFLLIRAPGAPQTAI